jgi:SAM-dependent methyltransferase
LTPPLPSPPPFDEEYYRRQFGVDDLRRFSVAWWSIGLYARMARRLLRAAGGRRMLEIGCAHGHVLARIGGGIERVGLDVSEYAVRRAADIAPGAQVFVADICGALPAPVLAGRFDLVLARYVLEHLADPALAMTRIASLVRPGGTLLFSVPDTTSPGRRFKKEAWFGFRDPTHVSLLPPARWRELTAEAGLTVVRCFSDGLWDVPYVRGLPKTLQYALFGLPAAATVLLARPLVPAGWGENLIVIARRPARASGAGDGETGQ